MIEVNPILVLGGLFCFGRVAYLAVDIVKMSIAEYKYKNRPLEEQLEDLLHMYYKPDNILGFKLLNSKTLDVAMFLEEYYPGKFRVNYANVRFSNGNARFNPAQYCGDNIDYSLDLVGLDRKTSLSFFKENY